MKNKIITFILLIFIIFAIVWWYIYLNKKTENKKTVEENILTHEEKEELAKKQEITDKINGFKKNVASKWLIINWDIHLQNDDYLFALQKFMQANKETPNNPQVLSKIAETYFLMKKYDSAYNYYSKIEDENFLDKNQKTLSYLYLQKLEEKDFEKNSSWSLTNSWNIILWEIKEKIKTFKLDKENEFYYLTSIDCINDFHKCKEKFQNYFKNTQYSWKNENLENIRNTIKNYDNLKLDEIYYKDALIIWSILQNKNYPISIILSKQLLKKLENYKPIIKIIAQSYFELDNLTQANNYLLKHTKLDWKSPDVSYMLWIIAQKNRDYIKSNIFLNLSIDQKYSYVDDAYRLQLYNYLLLGNQDKILDVFDRMIESNDKPNFNDLMLATYYNIINNNFKKALDYANKWIITYPKNEDFYWFKAWILIENKNFDSALELLNKASEINPKNALIILNLWRISKIKYETSSSIFDKTKAKLLFKKVIMLDSAEIWDLAKKYLEELEEKEKIVD